MGAPGVPLQSHLFYPLPDTVFAVRIQWESSWQTLPCLETRARLAFRKSYDLKRR